MIGTPWQTARATFVAFALMILAGHGVAQASDSVWQWSVPVGEGRAFLWIPENCERVRAVVLAQHNMIERGILQHPTMRHTLAELDMAEVFIVPSADAVFQFDRGAGERFESILQALAEKSGYIELGAAPVVPMGHSAHASFPWNFAAWNPRRTLAVLSVKGDAPLTVLTGSGRPNPDWGTRTLDGVPGLMVMGEYEWWEARLAPLMRYRAEHPASPLAVLCDAGRGHFDATNNLVEFLCLFLRKAAAARLPLDETNELPGNATRALRAVDPASGWLVDRWRGDEPARAAAAPASQYTGERAEAFWCFDEAMARATEAYYATSRCKQRQQVSFVQEGGFVPITNSHGGIELKFLPEDDGLTFRIEGDFITPLPPNPPVATKDKRPPPTSVVPARAAPGSHAPGEVQISAIIGPVEAVAANTFRVTFDRMYSPKDRRTSDVWLLASHSGDAIFKSAVQQALLQLPRFDEGAEQVITFLAIADMRRSATSVALAATSDSGLPVSTYVREGPAFVRDGVLHLTRLPPRAKLPITITVVAWQFGRGSDPKFRAAMPVERTFSILP